MDTTSRNGDGYPVLDEDSDAPFEGYENASVFYPSSSEEEPVQPLAVTRALSAPTRPSYRIRAATLAGLNNHHQPAQATQQAASAPPPPVAGAPPQQAPAEPLYSIRLTPVIDFTSASNFCIDTKTFVRRATQDGVFKIGRYHQDSEILADYGTYKPIILESRLVSRVHAELVLIRGHWHVRDVGSSAGTYVNDIRLPTTIAGQSAGRFLMDGDVIKLGVDFVAEDQRLYKAIALKVEVNKNGRREPESFKYQL